jgi:DNA-binding NarL/FixJ family response regulator
VLLDIATGLTNPEIATHLRLSESTVKTHISRVLAVIIAYDAGLVGPGSRT